MAFNKRALWRYIYENDTGEYLVLNEVLKQTGATPADYAEIKAHLLHLGGLGNGFIDLQPRIDDFAQPYNINNFGKGANNLDNFPIQGKITDNGRWYYIRAYLAQEFTDSQKAVSDSVVTTNKFIRWTLWAVIGSAIIQCISICIVHSDAQSQIELSRQNYQQEQSKDHQQLYTAPHDSLQATSNGSKK